MHPFSNIVFGPNLHCAGRKLIYYNILARRNDALKNVVVYAQVMICAADHYPKRSAYLINTTSGGTSSDEWLQSRFIKRLILDGKKGAATRIFDASLELLKKNIEQYLEDEGKTSVSGSAHKRTTLTLTEKNNLYLLANLTKEEIFVTALRKAQP